MRSHWLRFIYLQSPPRCRILRAVQDLLKKYNKKPPTSNYLWCRTPMQEERRKHPRVMLRWPIVAEAEERIVYGTTADVSISGAFINCHSPLELGKIFDLIIQDVSLVDCPLPLDSSIRITAGVVRTQDYDPDKIIFSHGMAVRFLKMLENEQEVISTLITHTLQKDRINSREEKEHE